jgi:ABC-type nickel/cobalt efflux system permease component RcnA
MSNLVQIGLSVLSQARSEHTHTHTHTHAHARTRTHTHTHTYTCAHSLIFVYKVNSTVKSFKTTMPYVMRYSENL